MKNFSSALGVRALVLGALATQSCEYSDSHYGHSGGSRYYGGGYCGRGYYRGGYYSDDVYPPGAVYERPSGYYRRYGDYPRDDYGRYYPRRQPPTTVTPPAPPLPPLPGL